MFSHSNNVNINGGEFHVTVSDSDAKTSLTPEEVTVKFKKVQQGIESLRRSIAPGASHNSDERYDPPKCHPHTREAILQEIMDWIKDNDRLTRCLWLYGPAGAGKSAIEQTIAELCYEMNFLAASFFFSRSVNGRNRKTFLITTIVDQLIESIPEIREHVGIALHNNPSLLTRSLEAQMDGLVVKPLEEAASVYGPGVDFMNSRPKVIVLDGLDECGDPESQRYILKVLMNSINKHSIPFSFVLGSRPEQHIREAFDVKPLSSLTTRLVLDDKYQPDVDIRMFLRSKFQDIKNRHPSHADLPSWASSWPSDEEVERLVQKSSGQFIYASTVTKFIDSHRHWPPDRLDIIFGISPCGKTTPFAEINSLYSQILTSASDSIDRALKIFAVLLFLHHQDLKISPRFIESFFSLRRGEVFTILSDLHSIIAVPSVHERYVPLRLFHASLGDFFTDHSRSGDTFFLDSGVCHRDITNRIIKRLMNPPRAIARVHFETPFIQAVFPEQCLKATPDPEFLSNLYGFDMSLCPHRVLASTSHITQIFTENFDAINSASRVPELLVWMQSQKHPDQRENLFSYHRQSIQLWLHKELFAIKPGELPTGSYNVFQHMLASATLVDFPQFRDIHHLIPQVMDLTSMYTTRTKRDYHQIEDSDKWEIYVKYRKIVSRFLIDRTRSEIQRDLRYSSSNGQEHYVSLAKYLLHFLSQGLYYEIEKYEVEVDIPKAVLTFLPIVFSQAGRSARALDLLGAGSFSFDPQLPRRFPQENWDQLFSSCFETCKLAIAAEGDRPMIPEPEIGTENTIVFSQAGRSAAALDLLGAGSFSFDHHENWDQLFSSSFEASKLAIAAEGDKPIIPEPEIGTENRDQLLSSSYKPCKLPTAAESDKPTMPEPDAEIGTSSRGSGRRTMSRWFKGLFKPSKS